MSILRSDGTLRPADRTDFRRAFTPGAIFATSDGPLKVRSVPAGELGLPSGRIIATDPCYLTDLDETPPFAHSVAPGSYPVRLVLAHPANASAVSERVACMLLQLSAAPALHWAPALHPGERLAGLVSGQFFGHTVDSGLACFVDAVAVAELASAPRLELYHERIVGCYTQEFRRIPAINLPLPGPAPANVIACSAGYGDGAYPSWWGYDETGAVCVLATDFFVLVEDLIGTARFPLAKWADRTLLHPDLPRIGARAWLPPVQPGDRELRVVIDGADCCEVVVETSDGRVIGAGGHLTSYDNRIEHRLCTTEPLPDDAVLVLTYTLGMLGL